MANNDSRQVITIKLVAKPREDEAVYLKSVKFSQIKNVKRVIVKTKSKHGTQQLDEPIQVLQFSLCTHLPFCFFKTCYDESIAFSYKFLCHEPRLAVG